MAEREEALGESTKFAARVGIKGPHWSCSPRASQSAIARSVGRKKEKAGCEESRLRNQRWRVEGSGTRSGSLRDGAAFSNDLCSRKYRRSAWLRATRL